MSCIEKILKRRSIRRYRKEPVPDEVRDRILEAGRQAPSAANRQPWHFIVVTDPELKEKLATGRYNRFIRDSTFTIVGVSLPYDPVSEKWGVIDVTIAMQNMVLAAEVQGVGSCWIGDFKEDEVKELLGIPEEAKVVALLPMGLPDEQPGPKPKKPLSEIVHYNKW
ncbi:nitroreductase [Candidatus Bathyarchaeota archaeon]|nr:MAG: nitroreductase [Candidatus Bathyarchaeota archaeon]